MSTITTWGELFYNISPYSWAYVGIGIALGASVIGAAWYSSISFRGIYIAGASILGAAVKAPRIRSKNLVRCNHPLFSVIFCEAVAIYGVIMAIILQGKINESQCLDTTYASCAFSGYALFWTGVSVGFSNLFCGYLFLDEESVWEYQVVAVQLPTRKILTPLLRF